MEYEPDNTNRRDELLSHFRESLTRPLSDRYVDEDELLEVFDYAGDIGDDYLRMEALLCAARYFPDSEDFNQRKAIFYNQYSQDTINKYIDDNQDASGMMWDIMRARRAAPEDDKSKKDILNTIVNSYDEFNDEEVIQLIDLVVQFDQIQWLKDNMPLLRSKVAYLNILLYETAVAADTCQDAKYSVQMLEWLTELEPFNFFFWMMLAREYEILDQGEKALGAIDYALAINPEDPQSLLTKAKLLYVNNKDQDEIVELLKRVLNIKPDLTEAVQLLANVYNVSNNNILASVVLNEFIEKHPEAVSELVPDMVLYRPKNMPQLLDKFYTANEDNSQIIWASWAHQLSQNGYADVSEQVLKAYERNSGNKIFSLNTIENLFNQGRFEDAITELSEYLNSSEDREINFPSIVMIHLLSMIKLQEYEHAEAFCQFIIEHTMLSQYSDIASRLEYLGMRNIVIQIRDRLRQTKEPADWADFDPLELWQI